MSKYGLIRDAIISKKQVICRCKGRHREMCPHTIGYGKSGAEMVLSFQFAGESSSGLLPATGQWRCMSVADITDVIIRDGPWHTGTGHDKPQTCVKEIDLEVAY